MGKRSKKKLKPKQVQEEDDRFLDLAKNPMFREMAKKERKVKIDDRFTKMLTNKSFEERNFQVDKRGRPIRKKKEEGYLNQLYELDQSKDEETKSEDESDEGSVDEDRQIEDDQEGSDEDEDDLLQINFDLARGQGNISSSSGDEEEDGEVGGLDEDKGQEDNLDDAWNQLDRGAPRVEWASTRLAICNCDWSRVSAEDLLLVLLSFTPPNGSIESVSIYLSDFGAERLEEEKKHGPQLKIKAGAKEKDLDDCTKQAIRTYELDKLRYYYAVCVCESIETSTAIYESCDGVEYESSGMRLDMRFVPEGMEFEEDRVHDRIKTDEVNVDRYKTKKIVSHALVSSDPKITWEETDPERKRTLREAFDENAKLEDFDSLVASGSDDEEEDETIRKSKYELLIAAARESIASGKHILGGVEEGEQIGNARGIGQEVCEDEEDEDSLSDEEEEEPIKPKKKTKFQLYLERKKQIKQERKQKEKDRRKDAKKNEASKKAEQTEQKVEEDSRFKALFTDSAFNIDKTSARYKGGNLAERQVKQKRRHVEEAEPIKKQKRVSNDESGEIVERLKRRQGK